MFRQSKTVFHLLISVAVVIAVFLIIRHTTAGMTFVTDVHPTDIPIFLLVENKGISESDFDKSVAQNKMDVNQVADGGVTPLHHAVYYNKKAIAYLVHDGANINARDEEGNTPLMLASMSGRVDEVEILVRLGADINISNNSNLSPLDIAKKNCHSDLPQSCSVYNVLSTKQ